MSDPRRKGPGRPDPTTITHVRGRRAAAAAAALVAAGGASLALAPSAFALSSAPTHGKTTCAIAGDECTYALSYANAHDGGSATVLAVEADVETHGSSAGQPVFDVRVQTATGVYVVHVLRGDTAPANDSVWWQSRAESAPTGSTGSTGSTDAPDSATGSSGSSGVTASASDAPRIDASAAATLATSFAAADGRQVLGVKHEDLTSSGQKDYYTVKLQLGSNGANAGTTTVWVDATSASGTVTAAQGSGIDYRDVAVVPAATAQASAASATGGGTVYKTTLHGEKWRWYWVFVQSGGARYKVGVDAVTGTVTEVRAT